MRNETLAFLAMALSNMPCGGKGELALVGETVDAPHNELQRAIGDGDVVTLTCHTCREGYSRLVTRQEGDAIRAMLPRMERNCDGSPFLSEGDLAILARSQRVEHYAQER